MVCIANYDNGIVIGCTREDGVNGGLEFLADCEALGLTVTYKTQAELDTLAAKQLVNEKWSTLSTYLSTLTVTTTALNTFDVSPSSLESIMQRVNTMIDSDTDTWYEEWATFIVNRVELQEALVLHAEAKKAKITELFGVA